MTQVYFRVTPTSANLEPNTITIAIKSLHKLSGDGPEGLVSRLNPFRSEQSLTFEFVASSEGKDAPVEFYHGADALLDVLQQRLRSIYLDSFDIDRIEVDFLEKLIQPVENPPAEFNERVKDGQLYADVETPTAGQTTVSDGGDVAVASDF